MWVLINSASMRYIWWVPTTYAFMEKKKILLHHQLWSGTLSSNDTFCDIQRFFKRTVKVQISLYKCAGWSSPSLSAFHQSISAGDSSTRYLTKCANLKAPRKSACACISHCVNQKDVLSICEKWRPRTACSSKQPAHPSSSISVFVFLLISSWKHAYIILTP